MKIDEYKCPNCGGTVKFDSSAQTMKCPYCDTEFELAAIEEYQKEVEALKKDDFAWGTPTEGEAWGGDDQDDLTAGSCPSCGAELFGDENTVATVCPCCGNAQIVAKRLSGDLKPNYVIPFKLEKKAAVDAMKEFCKGKRLLPKYFVHDNHIESMQGVYAPFWLFDANAHGHVTFKATKTRVWKTGDYLYKETSHYSALRDGNLGFSKVPVDASEKMDDAYMDAIEPFDYSQMKDFNKAFLAGYLAEKYDVDADKSKERAERRIKSTLEKEFRDSVSGYTTVIQTGSTVNVKDGKVNYALFPVWVLNSKYEKENYQFMMNGQTGRLVGRLPVDQGKAWAYRGVFAGIFGVILSALAFFAQTAGAMDMSFLSMVSATGLPEAITIAWVLAIAGGVGIVEWWKYKMNTARMKTNAGEYMVPGSLVFNVRKDTYLYKTVTKTAIASKAAVSAAMFAGIFMAAAGVMAQSGAAGTPDGLKCKPSFDCKKASTDVEKMICSFDALACLDSEMAEVYAKAKASGGEALLKSQREFLKSVAKCGNASCAMDMYRDRIAIIEKSIPASSLSFVGKTGGKPADFVPARYELHKEIKGDLNNDGLEDYVLVMRWKGEDHLGRIFILFNKGTDYELVLETKKNVYIGELEEVSIEKGVLNISFDCGCGMNRRSKYSFRYQNSDFELIGYWSSAHYQGSGGSTSINFSTKKMKRVDFVDWGEENEKWYDLTLKGPLKKLRDFGTFNYSSEGEETWVDDYVSKK